MTDVEWTRAQLMDIARSRSEYLLVEEQLVVEPNPAGEGFIAALQAAEGTAGMPPVRSLSVDGRDEAEALARLLIAVRTQYGGRV
jgi:hypothetical protein